MNEQMYKFYNYAHIIYVWKNVKCFQEKLLIIKLIRKAQLIQIKKTDDIQPLDTFNIWKRSLVDTKWKRSWIRSNLSDGARQRFIIPTFSKSSPVFFFSLGMFLSPSGDLGIGMVWDNHPPPSYPIRTFWSECWNLLQTELN